MKNSWWVGIIVPSVQAFSAVQLPGTWVDAYTVGLGTYNGEPAAFLSKKEQLDSVRDEVFPLPIDPAVVKLLDDALNPGSLSRAALLLACNSLVNRDGTAYDQLPWSDWGKERAKNDAFGRMQGRDLPVRASGYTSAYDVLAYCIAADCRGVLKGVFVEEEDDTSSGGISLGGALCLQKLPEMMQFMGEQIARPFSGGEQAIVECTIDEAVGLALAQGLCVSVQRDLWESATVRASFTMENDRLRLNCNITGDKTAFSTTAAQAAAAIPPEMITSAPLFMRMSDSQKRGTLRISGIKPPRRRHASSARLDELVLPLLDETVRRDVLLRQALARGDYSAAQRLCGGRSERSIVQSAIADAMEEGDLETVKQLQLRLEVLTERRADVTQDEGSYDSYLDADDWYVRERKAAMRSNRGPDNDQ